MKLPESIDKQNVVANICVSAKVFHIFQIRFIPVRKKVKFLHFALRSLEPPSL